MNTHSCRGTIRFPKDVLDIAIDGLLTQLICCKLILFCKNEHYIASPIGYETTFAFNVAIPLRF